MSEQNKQLIRELWGAVPTRDFAKIASVYDDNVVYHGPGGEERTGRQAAVDVARMHMNAFPDLKGELMGMAPTGKKLDLKWVMHMVRIQNGKVVEEWEIFDQMDFMKQLGMAG